MSLKPEGYIDRLVDEKINTYLSVFGAISIEGPKWCGKTWTSLNHANSFVSLEDENSKARASLNPSYILEEEKPELIDEWNVVPPVWDVVRRNCDKTQNNGNYILTCSTKLTLEESQSKIFHSGAGRIGHIKMYPMSLYESGDSDGKASIMDMYNGKLKNGKGVKEPSIDDLAQLIIRGGWPRNINVPTKSQGIIPRDYVESILSKDIYDDKNRNRNKMEMLLRSLARNESTVVSNATLLNDIADNESKDILEYRGTLDEYLNVLNRLHLIENQNAYSENYRSRNRVGKSPKRHFVDPSIACACLNLTSEMLVKDVRTLGFLFEALVERDLRIYMDSLDGKLYHFRDNTSGIEVDSILEFPGGEYAAVEIKLGFNQVKDAEDNLLKFASKMSKPPKFMCVIVGLNDMIVKDKETGIYIVPITSLKP